MVKSGFYNYEVCEDSEEISTDDIDYAVISIDDGQLDVDDEKLKEIVENDIPVLKETSSYYFNLIRVNEDGSIDEENPGRKFNIVKLIQENLVVDMREDNYIMTSSMGVNKVK